MRDVTDKARGWYESVLGKSILSDAAAEAEAQIKSSKLTLSRIYHKAPGLAIGGAVGSLLGYRLG